MTYTNYEVHYYSRKQGRGSFPTTSFSVNNEKQAKTQACQTLSITHKNILGVEITQEELKE